MISYKTFKQKKRFLAVKLSILLISLLILNVSANAQKKVGYAFVDTGSKKIVDLSKVAQRECTGLVREETGQSFVEVRFQPQFASEAKETLLILKKVIEKTQEVLSPLQVNGVRFYLLQIADAPKSYKIVLLKQDNLFLYLEAFDKQESISLDCIKYPSFCEKLYKTIPHEITHPLLEDLIAHDKTRWFEDGLAEYVGTEITRELNPNIGTREKEISLQSTLHREEMRQQLFEWGELYSSVSPFKGQKEMYNESQRYEASQQLIRLMIEESKKKGIERPLSVLLEKLKQFTKQKGKPASREELFALIGQHLKVDVQTLGRLDAQTQKSFVQEATEILAKEQTSSNLKNKFYALNTLASIDEIALSDEWINFLSEIVYNEKEDDFIQSLAATALARRMNQNGFDEVIEKLQHTNLFFKKKKLDSIKKDFQEKSLRPIPKID